MRTATQAASARHDPNVFHHRVDAAMRLAAGANLAYALSVVVLFIYVARPQFTTFGWVWMALAIPFAALSVAALWVGRRRSPVVRQWYLRVLAVAWTTQATVNLMLVVYLLPRVDSGRQTVLVATFAGTLGTGAIVMSTLRSMGILWVAVHVIIVAPAFWSMGEPAYYVLTVQLLIYGGVLIVAVIYLADSFKRRSLAEGRAQQSQQVVELLLDDFEDGSRDWLWETGPDGVFTRAPERLAEVSGRAPADLLRMSLMDLLERLSDRSEPGVAALRALSDALARAHGFRDLIIPVVVRGTQRWWSLSAKPIMSTEGTVVGWRGVGSDATNAHIHEREMRQLADTDPLTGLANRRRFQEYLQACLNNRADGEHYVLAIFDLDNFKSVNDTLGHGVGDQLLEQVASRLEQNSATDFVARLGGDEFAVILRRAEVDTFPEVLFAEYQSALAPRFTVSGNRVHITSSVGIAHTSAETVGAEELVRMADLALYDAKAIATGRMSVFTPTMSIRAHSRAALLADLDRAIDHDEFVFYFQPQHDVRTGRVVAIEALLRWQHPTRGLLPPSAFLDAAEGSGLLVPIGAHMLRRACERLSTLGEGVRLAVNVSLVELEDPEFLDRVEQVISEFGIDPRRLELEVTESATATAHSNSVLRELRQMGVRVAVDDFGTGYSSLARLQSMPVDVLKVDRAFSASLRAGDPRTRQAALVVMKSVVDMAKVLGIQTLAEGIERQEELAQVRDLGFDYVQGFFVGTPVPEIKRHLAVVAATPPGQDSATSP